MNIPPYPVIAICIATYKRPSMLLNCIKAIIQIERPEKYNIIIIVVDNDENESARNIIESESLSKIDNIYYTVEINRGIASARNRLLKEACKYDAEYIGFIDDDEFPDSKWLVNHLKAFNEYDADIVAGPVIPTYETTASEKIKIDIKHTTGYTLRNVAAGNVIFKNLLVSTDNLQFDIYYNFIGGEDFDFFDRATKLGRRKVWCSEAIIYETIPEERRTIKYLFYRHFTGAINNVMYYKKKNHSLIAWPHFLIKSSGKLFGSLAAFLIYILTLNNDRLEKSIIKFASATGYISGLLNIIIERYR
jgi:succinoglycan biosynthesis protein ExoM